MNTTLGYLRLYLKAGWQVTAILIGTLVGASLIWRFTGEMLVPYWYPILFTQSVILAMRFLPVDKLLFTSGVTPLTRMGIAFAGWISHLGAVAVALAVTMVLSGPKGFAYFQHVYLLNSTSPATYRSGFILLVLVLGSSLLWIDLQARRLAGMGSFDSAIFMTLGQGCILFFAYNVGYHITLYTGPIQSGISRFLITGGACVLLCAVISRLFSIHSLLKNSEVA